MKHRKGLVTVMTKILDHAEATADQMAAYLLSVNPAPQISMTVMDFQKRRR